MTASFPKRSRPFTRTRQDHAQETAEDYVEAIDDLIKEQGYCRSADLARLFDVTHVSIHKTVSRLKTAKLVEAGPYGPLRLTRKGERLASLTKQRHDVVFAALIALGVGEEQARIDAEGIEHHVSKETLQAFRRLLSDHQRAKPSE
jgi:DtxR family transcriptional regulator, manganese transport regulator